MTSTTSATSTRQAATTWVTTRCRRVARALVEVAGGLQVYRLGGDEFTVILEGETLETGYALGARVLELMPQGLTLSCGVAALAAGARSADLLRAADQALYVAKRSGRARVCVASSDAAWAWPEKDPDQGAQQRRGRRRRIEVDRLLDRTLAALDGPLVNASIFERLEAVMSLSAAALGLARAAVSHTAPGSATSRQRSPSTIARDGPGRTRSARRPTSIGSPTTRRRRRSWPNGGSFFVDVANPEADPTEVALLREWGLETMIAAAACRGDSHWLVELYADEQTAALDRAHGCDPAPRRRGSRRRRQRWRPASIRARPDGSGYALSVVLAASARSARPSS